MPWPCRSVRTAMLLSSASPAVARVHEQQVACDLPVDAGDEHPTAVQVGQQLGLGVLGELERPPQRVALAGVLLDTRS